MAERDLDPEQADQAATAPLERDDLLKLLEQLRETGFSIGVGEILNAHEAAHFAEARQPGNAETLRNCLAATLCTTPQQQQTFYELFDEWHERQSAQTEPPPPLRERPALEVLARQEKRSNRFAWISLSTLLIVSASLLTFFWPEPVVTPPDVQGETTPSACEAPPCTDLPPRQSEDEEDGIGDAQSSELVATVAPSTNLHVVDHEGARVEGVSISIDNALLGHDGPTRSVEFDTDGKRIVTASDDGTARIWDAGTGMATTTFRAENTKLVAAAFTAAGDRVVTASADGTLRIWDTDTQALIDVRTEPAQEVQSATFDSAGNRVVTISNGSATIWEINTGFSVPLIFGHSLPIQSATFNPTGDLVLTASKDTTARLWDLNGNEIGVLEGHGDWINSALFNSTGNRVVTASKDGTVRVWDVSTRRMTTSLQVSSGPVRFAVFDSSGDEVITFSSDGTVSAWDANTGDEIEFLGRHTSDVFGVATTTEGLMAVASSDGARIWEPDPRNQLAVYPHPPPATSVSFSPTGNLLATLGFPGTPVKVWNVDTGELVASLGNESVAPGYQADFSPDGNRIVTGSQRNYAPVWDTTTGELTLRLRGHSSAGIFAADYHPSGQRIATAGDDGSAMVWDATTGELIRALEGHAGEVMRVAFNSTGTRILTSSADKTARLWEFDTGREIAALENTVAIPGAKFSPAGDLVVTVSADKSAEIWSAVSGEKQWELRGHTEALTSAEFNTLGDRVLTTSTDGTVRIWKLNTDEAPVVLEAGTSGDIRAAFNLEGDRVLTTSTLSATALTWDAHTGQLVGTLRDRRNDLTLTSGTFDPSGTLVVTTSQDGTARLWWTDRYVPTDQLGNTKIPTAGVPRNITVGDNTLTLPATPRDRRNTLFELAPAAPFFLQFESFTLPLQAAIAAALLAVFGLWMRRRWDRRQVVLDLRAAPAEQAANRVRIHKPDVEMFDAGQVAGLAVQARTRHASTQQALDIGATVQATVANLGAPTPVYADTLTLPVYLALVDRRGFRDQNAARIDAMLDELEQSGVIIERYDFDHDPGLFQSSTSGRYRALSEMLSVYNDCRLLVFSDGSGFLHPLTGAVNDSVRDLDAWEHRALLTPVAADHWGRREVGLANAGFVVVPASLDGLSAFLAKITNDDEEAQIEDPWRARYPELLLHREERWVSRDAPSTEDIEQLLRQLRTFLGARGYRWLCALAVYPELHWHLTLHLGIHLTQSDGSALIDETSLIDLTRLPWLRRGSMPAWLRVPLLNSLSETDETDVRALLRNLLEQQLEPDATFELHLARTDEDEERDWQRVLKDFFSTEPDNSPLADQVFVSFLFGKDADRLTFQAPDGWRRFVYDRGIAALGLHPLFVASLTILLISLLVYAIDLTTQYDPPGAHVSSLWTPLDAMLPDAADAISDDWISTPPSADVLAKFEDEHLVQDATLRSVSADTTRLVTTDGGRWARLWDADRPRLVATIEAAESAEATITGLAFHESNQYVRITFRDVAGEPEKTLVWTLSPVQEDAPEDVSPVSSPSRTMTIGGEGGTPFDLTCPGGVAVGLRGRAGDDIDRTELICRNPIGTIVSAGAVGGMGGSDYQSTLSCRAGETMVGLRVGTYRNASFSWLDGLGVRCSDGTTVRDLELVGVPSSDMQVTNLDCPPNQIAYGLFGRQGDLLDQVGLHCISRDTPAPPIADIGPSPNATIVPLPAPTTTAFGEPINITNIVGYRVYWGSVSGQYDHTMDVGLSPREVAIDLPPGTWFITSTMIDADGNESRFFNEITRTVSQPADTPAPPILDVSSGTDTGSDASFESQEAIERRMVLIRDGTDFADNVGFLWKQNDQVVTTFHSIMGERFSLGTTTVACAGRTVLARLVKVHREADLALLRTSEPLTDCNPWLAEDIDTRQPEIGAKLSAWTWLRSDPFSKARLEMRGIQPLRSFLSSGSGQTLNEIEAFGTPSADFPIYLFSGTMVPGYGGAAIYNEDRKLVAIALGGLDEGQSSMAWGVPAQALIELEVSDDPLPTVLIGSTARPSVLY